MTSMAIVCQNIVPSLTAALSRRLAAAIIASGPGGRNSAQEVLDTRRQAIVDNACTPSRPTPSQFPPRRRARQRLARRAAGGIHAKLVADEVAGSFRHAARRGHLAA